MQAVFIIVVLVAAVHSQESEDCFGEPNYGWVQDHSIECYEEADQGPNGCSISGMCFANVTLAWCKDRCVNNTACRSIESQILPGESDGHCCMVSISWENSYPDDKKSSSTWRMYDKTDAAECGQELNCGESHEGFSDPYQGYIVGHVLRCDDHDDPLLGYCSTYGSLFRNITLSWCKAQCAKRPHCRSVEYLDVAFSTLGVSTCSLATISWQNANPQDKETVNYHNWVTYDKIDPECHKECPSDEWVQTASHCYLAVKQRMKWEDAMKHCEDTGDSHLTPMTSDEEKETLIGVMSAIKGKKYKKFWLGASLDLEGSGEITWADPDVESAYTNWDRNMPAKIKRKQRKRNNCVIVGQKNGKWSNKGPCKSKKGFVCRIEL